MTQLVGDFCLTLKSILEEVPESVIKQPLILKIIDEKLPLISSSVITQAVQ